MADAKKLQYNAKIAMHFSEIW